MLDICCGKGGDINKWLKQNIGTYVGVDLAEKSVLAAKERYTEATKRNKFPPKAIFMVNDVGDSNNFMLDKLDTKIHFDMVSC